MGSILHTIVFFNFISSKLLSWIRFENLKNIKRNTTGHRHTISKWKFRGTSNNRKLVGLRNLNAKRTICEENNVLFFLHLCLDNAALDSTFIIHIVYLYQLLDVYQQACIHTHTHKHKHTHIYRVWWVKLKYHSHFNL